LLRFAIMYASIMAHKPTIGSSYQPIKTAVNAPFISWMIMKITPLPIWPL